MARHTRPELTVIQGGGQKPRPKVDWMGIITLLIATFAFLKAFNLI